MRLIVLRLVPEEVNGTWMRIEREGPPPLQLLLPHPDDEGEFQMFKIVPTGAVEWDGFDNCAEVYIPEDRLAEWKAEHDLDHSVVPDVR